MLEFYAIALCFQGGLYALWRVGAGRVASRRRCDLYAAGFSGEWMAESLCGVSIGRPFIAWTAIWLVVFVLWFGAGGAQRA